MYQCSLLIGDQREPVGDLKFFDVTNPLTGKVVTRAAAASIADAEAAAFTADAASAEWAATGPAHRRKLLLEAADLFEARADEFIATMMAETGSTAAWAGFNVHLGAGIFREAAALATQVTGEVIPSDRPGCLALSIRQPVGVVLGIAPWNAPIILGARALATPLACGNAVILKSSERCPATHRLIGDVLRRAGLPPGVVNVVSNAPEDAQAIVSTLIGHPAVKRINFTGSTRIGRVIARLAAEHLKPALLELGGKAPLIVLDDADISEAVAAAAFGAFMNSGQICMSTERIIVDETVADEFVAALDAKVAGLDAGDPEENGAVLGPMISAAAAGFVSELIDDAIAKGGELHRGVAPRDSLVPASFVDRVTPDMRIYHEESFGPVAAVVRVNGDDEAVRVANDTQYGLSAAVFTRDINRALRVASRVQSGICHINGPTVHDEAQMPFGGVKQSGYGRFGGRWGIPEFTEVRWITISTQKGQYPI